jgi:hypothetical protein
MRNGGIFKEHAGLCPAKILRSGGYEIESNIWASCPKFDSVAAAAGPNKGTRPFYLCRLFLFSLRAATQCSTGAQEKNGYRRHRIAQGLMIDSPAAMAAQEPAGPIAPATHTAPFIRGSGSIAIATPDAIAGGEKFDALAKLARKKI